MLKHKYLLILLVIIFPVISVLSGCATIISGGPSKVKINTTPADAVVSIQGIQNKESIILRSASTILLNKNSDYLITASSSGYKVRSATINRELHGGVYFDGFWTVIGIASGYVGYAMATAWGAPGADPSMGLAMFAATIGLCSVPLITDIATNNIWYHTPDKIDIELIKE